METIVCHFWIPDPDGKPTLYEEEYLCYPIRDGLMRHAKVYNSERPCHCPERKNYEERLAASTS